MKRLALLTLIACATTAHDGTAQELGAAGRTISVEAARQAVEGPQPEPGPDGYGELTLAELMERLGVPGVSVAVVRDFEIHWARGYGTADVETGAAVDTETMFQAASISKPVTAMATMEAVQDGLFALDDDINSILTSWTLDGEGFTDERPVTPRLLSSHTSGLGDGFGFPGYEPGEPLPTTVQILEGHELSNVGRVFMERPPLTFYEYSGGGVTLMELALTDARGMPFDRLMQERVLDPLGMTRSSFRQPISPAHDRNAARAHDGEGRGRGPKWHVYPEMAAAGLWTTPTDLARLMIEVQRTRAGIGGGRVVDAEHIDEMLTPVGVGPFAVGWNVSRRGDGWYFGHDGANWGFRALMLGHVVKGYGVVVMTNADQGGAVMGELLRRVQRAYEWDSFTGGVRRGFRP